VVVGDGVKTSIVELRKLRDRPNKTRRGLGSQGWKSHLPQDLRVPAQNGRHVVSSPGKEGTGRVESKGLKKRGNYVKQRNFPRTATIQRQFDAKALDKRPEKNELKNQPAAIRWHRKRNRFTQGGEWWAVKETAKFKKGEASS